MTKTNIYNDNESTGLCVCKSFVDVHVHLREPGYPEKETILTGTKAAAAGGYTVICPMPNLNPVPDTIDNIAIEQSIIDRDAVIAVLPYASITKGRLGKELVDIEALKGMCIAFSDDGSGVQSGEMMLRAMKEAARLGCIIAAHCEDNTLPGVDPRSEWGQIERDIELCRQAGCHYHVCHISSRKSVELIRQAKAEGVNITCETAPHYLVFCDEDVKDEGRFRMNPPLRTADDRQALIEGLADGTIDVIATDHAPHTAEQKSKGFAGSAMGIIGMETSFPVLYTKLVKTGLITMERLVEAMSEAPRRIFGIGFDEDTVTIDLDEKFTIDPETFLSKGRSTPFEGMEVYGRVLRTVHNGKLVYEK